MAAHRKKGARRKVYTIKGKRYYKTKTGKKVRLKGRKKPPRRR